MLKLISITQKPERLAAHLEVNPVVLGEGQLPERVSGQLGQVPVTVDDRARAGGGAHDDARGGGPSRQPRAAGHAHTVRRETLLEETAENRQMGRHQNRTEIKVRAAMFGSINRAVYYENMNLLIHRGMVGTHRGKYKPQAAPEIQTPRLLCWVRFN